MEFSVHTGQRNAENASCSVSYTFIKLLKPLVSRTSLTGPLALQILSSPRFPCNNLAPRRITRRPALLTYSSSARLSRTRLCSPFAIFTMRSPASPDEVLSRLPLMSTTSTSWILRGSSLAPPECSVRQIQLILPCFSLQIDFYGGHRCGGSRHGLSAPFRPGLTAHKPTWALGIPRHLMSILPMCG